MKLKIFSQASSVIFLLMIGSVVRAADINLNNPLTGTTENYTFYDFAAVVINSALGISGVLALMMFIWGGLQWMTSAGSDRVKKGKETIKWAVLGLLLIFFSYAIINTIFNLIGVGNQ